MKSTRSTLWKLAAATAALLCLLALALLGVLQSGWFRDEVRRRIVAQVETATGGKVEIAAFDYNWRNLTADLHGFVIHGTEPAAAAPLLRVDSARVTVKIISILERSADISSIILTRPQVNLIVAADGTTNLPTPRQIVHAKDPVQRLFALKLKHFAIQDGLAMLNEKRLALNVRGDGVEIVVDYRTALPSYQIALSSRQVDFGLHDVERGPLSLSVQASFGRDRLTVQKAELLGARCKIETNGILDHYAHPRAAFQLNAAAATDEILPLVKFAAVRGGRVALRGAARYDESGGWSFAGKVETQDAGYYSTAFSVKSINATADVDARKSGLTLRHLTASARGAKFVGEATLKNYRNLSLEGNIGDLTLREAASFFTERPLAWQGAAAGRVGVTATLAAGSSAFAVRADLVIAPASGGIPVSGAVALTYLAESNALEFGPSHLNFPSSNVSFSGTLRDDTRIVIDSSNLEELKPVISLVGLSLPPDAWPVLLENGLGHFDGSIGNMLSSPKFEGRLQVSDVRVAGQVVDSLDARFNAGANGIDIASLDLRQGSARLNGVGLLGFEDWSVQPESALRAAVALRGVSVTKVAAFFPQITLPMIQGIASGSLQLRGSVAHPEGSAHITSDALDAYGERLNELQFDADLTGDQLRISKGRVVSGAAVLSFSGDYLHRSGTWSVGQARLKVDTNGFPLASLSPVRKYEPALNAQAELHFEASGRVSPGRFEPLSVDGAIDLRQVTWNKVPYGSLLLRSTTRGERVDTAIGGDLRKNPLHGTATVELKAGNLTHAEIDFDRLTAASLYALASNEPPLFDGELAAKLTLEGPLQDPAQMRATLRADKLQLASRVAPNSPDAREAPAVSLHNAGPLVLEAEKGVATVRSFRIEGDNTRLDVAGTIPFEERKPLDLRVTGSVNLQVYHLFDPHVTSAGVSLISATVGGTLRDPAVNGTLEIKDGSFLPQNAPNGLSAVNGTLTFNRDRATLQKMTAKSGGGDLTLGGFLSFGGGGPLVYHLEGSADNVRVRYAGSISVTSSAQLRLSGTSNSSLLSGTLTVSRVVFNTNTDVGNILAGLGSGTGAASSENDFLTGLHLDVLVESAPNLQLRTSLSRDVEAEINLRLRGTPDHPVLLGNLSANQGDIQAFGTRYTINRGEISFLNPVKIEPALDLDLETRARGVTVDITISGTFSKLNISYRSDPPLQPREIIALLAVGRAPDSTDTTKTLRTNDQNALQSGANSLLGAAVTSPVTNRLQKLFGITNIRVDPLVQGITNTPQTRVTLEQQISRDITITYITNLSQTSEQIFRLEWALSRQFSVVALRDDNGEFGIDFQYKKQFK